ncbi:MAG: spore cortex biosynthesis protein YabQ [Ruminococcus sp.]|nr:spore cortex biosynthesis protein YabQ [Ruminococcus sp.]
MLGLLYEPLRVFYKLGFNGKIFYFICDTLFMIICGVITFYFSLAFLEGQIRFFVFLGEILGFIVYYHTIRRLFDVVFNPIITIFKKILKKLLKTSRKVMYNIKIKLERIVKSIRTKITKVREYEKKQTRKKRKGNRGEKERDKRSHSSKEKA